MDDELRLKLARELTHWPVQTPPAVDGLVGLVNAAKQFAVDTYKKERKTPHTRPMGILGGLVENMPLEYKVSTMLSQVPIYGDIAGLAADAYHMAKNPEERTWTNAGLSALGALPMIPMMTAWHGSPHKFDKVDLSKVGTGEGAQAYGHGFYAAENPGVAGTYKTVNQDVLIDGRPITIDKVNDVNDLSEASILALRARDGDIDGAIEYMVNKGRGDYADELREFDRNRIQRPTGYLYELDIPDETIDKMLDWDAPLSEQPESVRRAFSGLRDKRLSRMSARRHIYTSPPEDILENAYMGDWYDYLAEELGGQQAASEYLNSLGIPGIKYLDGSSRSAGKGTRNFVLFNEDDVKILNRE